MTATLLALATEIRPGYTRFLGSCKHQGITPIIVEMGSAWWGFGWRFKRLIAAIKSLNTELILHCDAFDSVCLRNLPTAIENFAELNHAWVFSYEAWPQAEEYLHLNCGMWMANRDYALSIITDQWLEEFFPDHFNDQYQMQAIYSWHPDWFKLDKQSMLFYTQNAYSEDLVELNGKMVSPASGTTPCFVHGPNKSSLANVDASG